MCTGAIDAPFALKGQTGADPLADMVATVESCGTQTQVLLAKVKALLGSAYRGVFKKDPPASLRVLVDELSAGEDPIAEYGRERTASGMTTALALTMAHGADGDFEKIASSYPVGSDGKEVELRPYLLKARGYAKQLAEVLEKRAVARAAVKRNKASKGASASQSAQSMK